VNEVIIVNSNQLRIKEYKNQRVVTTWDIARLHNIDSKIIRDNFRNNKSKLIENEDYFLIPKQSNFASDLIVSKEVDYHALNAAKEIVAFTESGYLMITKPMQDELSWQVQRQLVKGYFKLQEIKQKVEENFNETSNKSPNNQLEKLENVNKSLEFLTPLLDYAGVDNTIKLLVAKSFFSKAGIDIPVDIQADQKYYDTKQIGNMVGMYSKSGKPAYMAVNEILKLLDIEESEKTAVWETNGAWQGTVTKYSDSVVNKVKEWLEDKGHPTDIPSKNKTFHVSYSGGVQL